MIMHEDNLIHPSRQVVMIQESLFLLVHAGVIVLVILSNNAGHYYLHEYNVCHIV